MYPRCIPVSLLRLDHDGDVWYRAPSCSNNPIFGPAHRRVLMSPLSSLSHVSRARPPFPTLPPPRCCSTTQRSPCAIQPCLLLPLTSVLLLFAVLTRRPFPKDPAPFLQTKIIVVLAIHLPTDSYPRHNLHVAESLEGSSTSLVPCAYHHVPSAPAMYIRTDFVQSSRRRVHPSPPVPSPTMPLVAADRISEDLCAPLAPTCLGRAHRLPRSNDVVPSESGNRNEVHTP
ncbi:hypothetical protein K438DRAFT_2025611, partial [Mycena galopus ATCC 62051]